MNRGARPGGRGIGPAVLIASLLSAVLPVAAGGQERGAAALGAAIQGIGVTTRVLMIGAHPDDEDTQVIAWLSRGRRVETAYLSLTRGDGGQNAIGNELEEALGVIRTEELLAARRVDGGRQFFTRAYDYGFSKSAAEAFTQWPHDTLLHEVISIVRSFKPHVIISVFSGTPRDGHGQHQAAGILAREAYDLAADTVRVPRSATAGYGAWTVSKFYRGAGFRRDSGTIAFNVGEYDPLLGRSYAEIAAISRSQHRSQAFGTLQPLGVRFDYLQREASRAPAPADPRAEQSIFDGIDTTWNRLRASARTPATVAALDSLPGALAAARASFDAFAPERSIPALARVQRLLTRLCDNEPFGVPCAEPGRNSPGPAVPGGGYLAGSPPGGISENDLGRTRGVALARVNEALVLASGVVLEAVAPRELWSTAERVTGTVTLYNRGRLPVRVEDFVGVGGMMQSHTPVVTLLPDSALVRPFSGRPIGRPTAPWWLAQPRRGAMFANLRNRADEANALPDGESRRATETVSMSASVDGAAIALTTPIVYRYADQVRGEIRRPIAGVPPVSVFLDQAFAYAAARAPLERTIRVRLQSPDTVLRTVRVEARVPAGLVADSAVRTVTIPRGNAVAMVQFSVRGQLPAGTHVIEVVAVSDSQEFRHGYATIDYEHISPRRLYRASRLAIEAVDLASTGPMRVGYIQGVGDNIAPVLEQLGVQVSMLDPAQLAGTDLRPFNAIVVGPRAYEAHPALVANNARLLAWGREGGTLVVQYGQYEMQQPGIMPYPVTINRPHDRVTVEDAPVTILDATAAILNAPNRITARDFDGWVQDRSLYMPRAFDAAYTPLLAMSDPGEAPIRGALLVAPLGRGTYVYTTLAFFRQLPNGVPGAARLFMNLLAAGQARPRS